MIKSIYRLIFLIIFFSILFVSCTETKKVSAGRAYRNLTAYYNTYFNAKEIYKQDLRKITLANPDHFDRLLAFYKLGDEASAAGLTADMNQVILKSSNLIAKHDRSDWVDDAYLLMGKAYYLKGDYYQSLDNFQYIYNNFTDPAIKEAGLIWATRSYMKLDKPDDAQVSLDLALGGSVKARKMNSDELYTTAARFYLEQRDTLHTEEMMRLASIGASSYSQASRYYFIRAQLATMRMHPDEAIANYRKVLKLKPGYDLTFGAKLGLANIALGSDAIQKGLEKLLDDEKNLDYRDQVYYALGNNFAKEQQFKRALNYYRLSIDYNTGNTNQKGLAYEQMAEIYLNEQKDYKKAGAYYDSTMNFLSRDYSNYAALQKKQSKLGELVANFKYVAQEDTLLLLASLDTSKRLLKVQSIITDQLNRQKAAEQVAIIAYKKQMAASNLRFAAQSAAGSLTGNGLNAMASPQASFLQTTGGTGQQAMSTYQPSAANQMQIYAQGASNAGMGSAGSFGVSQSNAYSGSSGSGGGAFGGNSSGAGSFGNMSMGSGAGAGSFGGGASPVYASSTSNYGGQQGGGVQGNGMQGGGVQGNGMQSGGNQGGGMQGGGMQGGGMQGGGMQGGGMQGGGQTPMQVPQGGAALYGGQSFNTVGSGGQSGSSMGSGGMPGQGAVTYQQQGAGGMPNPQQGSMSYGNSQTDMTNSGNGTGAINPSTGMSTFVPNTGSTNQYGGSNNQSGQNGAYQNQGSAASSNAYGNQNQQSGVYGGYNTGAYGANPYANTSSGTNAYSSFYFANPQAMSAGFVRFVQVWGNRPLRDNWRRSSRLASGVEQSASANQPDSAVLVQKNKVVLETAANDPRQAEKTLMNLVPKNPQEIDSVTANMVVSYASIASIYQFDLNDAQKAISTYEIILHRFPENKNIPQFCFQLYTLNKQLGNNRNAELYKGRILKEFPQTVFASYFLHPEELEPKKITDPILEAYYDSTYQAYQQHDFHEVMLRVKKIPKVSIPDYLQPQFDYLNTLSIGYTQPLSVFEPVLKALAQNYASIPVGKEATALLKVIDSNRLELSDRRFVLEGYSRENGFELAQRALDRKEAEALAEKERIAAERKKFFSPDYNSGYSLLLVFKNSKVNMRPVRLGLSQFAEANFASLHLNNTVSLAAGKTAMIVGNFTGFKTAMNYYKHLTEVKEDVIPVAAAGYEFYIISKGNLDKIKTEDQLQIYREFFDDNYLPYSTAVHPEWPNTLSLSTADTKKTNSVVFPASTFSTNENSPYLLIIAVNSLKVNLNPVRLQISIFNQLNFANAKLNHQTRLLNNEILIISVNTFPDLATSTNYYKRFIADKPGISGLQASQYQVMLISAANYAKLKNTADLSSYFNFFTTQIKH